MNINVSLYRFKTEKPKCHCEQSEAISLIATDYFVVPPRNDGIFAEFLKKDAPDASG